MNVCFTVCVFVLVGVLYSFFWGPGNHMQNKSASFAYYLYRYCSCRGHQSSLNLGLAELICGYDLLYAEKKHNTIVLSSDKRMYHKRTVATPTSMSAVSCLTGRPWSDGKPGSLLPTATPACFGGVCEKGFLVSKCSIQYYNIVRIVVN